MALSDGLKKAFLSHADLLRLFKNSQQQLISIVQRYDASNRYASYRAKQLKAVDIVLKRLTLDVKDWTADEIPAVITAGADDVQEKIATFDEPAFDLDFAGVNERAVKILTEDAFLDFGKGITGMKQDASKAILNKQKLQEKIIEGVIQGSSVARTQTQLMDILKADGITALRGRNGARWRPEVYTSMLARTQTMTAYNLGARQSMLDVGRRYAIFPTIPPGKREPDDPCWEWEKKKFVDLLEDPVPPASTHPNCRHVLQPCSMEQLKAERPDLYEEALTFFQKTANA